MEKNLWTLKSQGDSTQAEIKLTKMMDNIVLEQLKKYRPEFVHRWERVIVLDNAIVREEKRLKELTHERVDILKSLRDEL